jgi:hypothetical protein
LKKIGAFFAVDNAVNEDTVMGVLFTIILIIAIFTKQLPETIYILSGMTLSFFGLGSLKK